MLTINSDPKELIEQLMNMTRVLKWMMCELFDKEIGKRWFRESRWY